MKRPSFADLPLRVKGLLLASVPVAALFVAVGSLAWMEQRQDEAGRWVQHTFEVRSNVRTLLLVLGDAESAVRGYLLTRDQALLAPYRDALRRFPQVVQRLGALTNDNRNQIARVRRIQQTAKAVLDSLTHVVNVFEQSASPVEMRSALTSSKQEIDQVRSELTAMHEEEQRLLAVREAQAEQARRRLDVLLAVSTGIGLLGGLLAPLAMARSVVRRIAGLVERAQLLAERRPLPLESLGGDEIGQLGGALAQADQLLSERESKLRETERFLQHLIETSPTVVFRQDPTTMKVTYVSANSERILGYKPAEILDWPHFWMDNIHPEDRDRVLAEDQDTVARRAPHVETEYRVRHKNGEYRWLRSFLFLQYGVDDYPIEIVGHRLDITERRQAEFELVERQATLDAANRELEAFSYSVSHDLRAPLRTIAGFSRILLEDYEERLDGQGRYYLDRMRAGAQHMGSLIDDLLKLSRLTRAQMHRERVDCSALVQGIADDLVQADPGRHVEFHIQPEVIAVGDPGLLRVLLENLLGNAWKFTSRHSTAHIEFGSLEQEGHTAYFVRDDGAGFDETYARKLFSAFQRLHTAAEFPGSGIGLATVQRIVRRHGGQVWASGEVEKGATFYFTLEAPAEEGGEGPPAIPAASADSPPA